MINSALSKAFPPNAAVDGIFFDWDRSDSPGFSLAVARDGNIIYSRGYGMADLDHGIPNTSNTVFNAASLAKQFTAMSILLLSNEIERGLKLIDLDEDVRQYIDKLDGLDRKEVPKITIRQMLHHISGIRDLLVLSTLAGLRWGDDVITRDSVLGLVQRMKTVNFIPGTRAHLNTAYSNTNYFLAGEIIRSRSGMSLAEFARMNIFEPLGMTNTRFVERHGEIVGNRAYGYRRLDSGRQRFEMRMPTYDFTGPAGLFTTVEDLIRWDRNFDKHVVGGKDAVEALQTPDANSNDYGLGLYVTRTDGKLDTFWHNGKHPGYRSILIRYCTDQLTVALLCNLDLPEYEIDDRAEEVASAIRDQLRLQPQEKYVEFVAAIEDTKISEPPDDLTEYVGLYHSTEIDSTFNVDRNETSLVIKRHTYPPISLEHISGHMFRAENFTAVLPKVDVTFLKSASKVTGLRLDGTRLVDFRYAKISQQIVNTNSKP